MRLLRQYSPTALAMTLAQSALMRRCARSNGSLHRGQNIGGRYGLGVRMFSHRLDLPVASIRRKEIADCARDRIPRQETAWAISLESVEWSAEVKLPVADELKWLHVPTAP